MTKIALFGTSADPPTAGHQSILRWLSTHYDWVGVWTSDNPFKNHQTSWSHRMTMLKLLVDDINLPKNNIYLSDKLSYRRSLMSLVKAKEIWGNNSDYSLVIGSDLVNQIHRWYHIKDLLNQVNLLIIPRSGYELVQKDLIALKKLGGNYQIADLDAPAVSSTNYRKTQNQSVLIQPIQEYICQEQLYQ
ncbi:nicotinate-nucleotide adenylyltransferase [Cyanobacterium sp. uoEpiScrs1]|uniref:nicotinate-nucleotide adenylyltransferase n=1 Tax=Cyanobacterium sp. uoEpiScrs1 TaxID=2976343 RepID=UPI002269E348|nr:nicotinate-nucleotide adenylyltransferase [Cyanobacterium sp. uoEpiScrs1]